MDDAALPGPGPARPEDLRAGHVDRELVLQRLRTAQAEGRLDPEEFEQRCAATLAARTYGDLAALTEDLPGGPPAPRPLGAPPPQPAAREGRPAAELRSAVAAWSGVSVTTLVIWAVIGMASGDLGYPWWIWVAGPWGVALLLSWLGTRSRGR